DYDRDFSRKTFGLNGICNGLKIRAATREQNAQFFHWSHALDVSDFAIALHDAANEKTFLTTFLNERLHLLVFFGRHDQDHAEAHVEGAQHFVRGNIADFLHVSEDRRDRPGAEFHDGGRAPGQHAGKIVCNSAAGDVGHASDQAGTDQAAHLWPIALVGP